MKFRAIAIVISQCAFLGCDSGERPSAPEGSARRAMEESAGETGESSGDDDADLEGSDGETKKAYDDSDVIFESEETSIAILPVAPPSPQIVTPSPMPAPSVDPAAPAPAPPPAPQLPQTPKTNQDVIDFSNNNIGKQVGNGLCSALQTGALTAASAKITTSFATSSPAGTNFSLLEENAPLFPGDIMHWAGGTNHNNYPAKPGDPLKPKIAGYLMFKAVPEGHVSIVREVVSPVEIKILHQNINNLKLVREDIIRLDAITSGKIEFFRPIPE